MDMGGSDAHQDRLVLQSRIGDEDPGSAISKTWGAFTVEHVRLKHKANYAFRLKAATHYVAIHDIKRTDGETFVSGLPRSTLKDLRDKITYIPKDCEVHGWVQLPARGALTAIYFSDLNLFKEQRLLRPDGSPLVHFNNDFLQSLIKKIEAVATAVNSEGDLYAESLCTVLFHEIARMQDNKAKIGASIRGGLTPRTFKTLEDFLNDNLSSKITLEELAKIAGVSRFHFVRSFKHTTGATPNQYLILLRVNRAKQLLSATALSVSEIASLVGFGSGTHLTKAFRQVTGMTPSEYRRRLS